MARLASSPIRSLFAKQTTHKEILDPAVHVFCGFSLRAVIFAGHEQEIEHLAGLDQGVNKPQGGLWWHIGVFLSDNQEQVALKAPGVFNVRTVSRSEEHT